MQVRNWSRSDALSGALPRGVPPVYGPLSCACLVVDFYLAPGEGGEGGLDSLAGGRSQVV